MTYVQQHAIQPRTFVEFFSSLESLGGAHTYRLPLCPFTPREVLVVYTNPPLSLLLYTCTDVSASVGLRIKYSIIKYTGTKYIIFVRTAPYLIFIVFIAFVGAGAWPKQRCGREK